MSATPSGPVSKSEVDRFFHLHELYTQTHAGEAMFCAAMIELELRKAILSKMRKISKMVEARIFDTATGFHQFSAKIIAYSLGLMTEKFYLELRTIKTIRDAFAHRPEKLTFFSPEIRKLIKTLNFKGKANYPNTFLIRVQACLEHISANVQAEQNT